MDIDTYTTTKKRKIDILLVEDFPKSEVLKNLTVEEQQKYAKLDKYLENITLKELKLIHNSKEHSMFLEPYDRLLFMVFLRNIVNKYS